MSILRIRYDKGRVRRPKRLGQARHDRKIRRYDRAKSPWTKKINHMLRDRRAQDKERRRQEHIERQEYRRMKKWVRILCAVPFDLR